MATMTTREILHRAIEGIEPVAWCKEDCAFLRLAAGDVEVANEAGDGDKLDDLSDDLVGLDDGSESECLDGAAGGEDGEDDEALEQYIPDHIYNDSRPSEERD